MDNRYDGSFRDSGDEVIPIFWGCSAPLLYLYLLNVETRYLTQVFRGGGNAGYRFMSKLSGDDLTKFSLTQVPIRNRTSHGLLDLIETYINILYPHRIPLRNSHKLCLPRSSSPVSAEILKNWKQYDLSFDGRMIVIQPSQTIILLAVLASSSCVSDMYKR